MCGRFFLATPIQAVAELFGVSQIAEPDWTARYNIAPTQLVPLVRDQGETRGRELVFVRWGLVPPWADDPSIGNRMINARSESIDAKPAFRKAFISRRCIVPADGFYEWKKISPRRKQPLAIRSADGRPLAMAGLWERWRPRTGDERGEPWLETCTILTCEANDLLRDVHDRMPVVLEPWAVDQWLDPHVHDVQTLKSILKPCPSQFLRMYPVDTWVNRPEHDDARCIEEVRPAAGDAEEGMLF